MERTYVNGRALPHDLRTSIVDKKKSGMEEILTQGKTWRTRKRLLTTFMRKIIRS